MACNMSNAIPIVEIAIAAPVLLEPMVDVVITAPAEHERAIVDDLHRHPAGLYRDRPRGMALAAVAPV